MSSKLTTEAKTIARYLANDRYILDDERRPVPCPDLLEWAKRYEDTTIGGERVVARETFGKSYLSTVFLAVSPGYLDPEDDLLLFETAMFFVDGEGFQQPEGLTFKYESWKAAEKGHAIILQEVRDLLEREPRHDAAMLLSPSADMREKLEALEPRHRKGAQDG